MLTVKQLMKDQAIIEAKKRRKAPPMISVIMPVYSRKRSSIETAVKSVLRQTFRDYELIIIDDGSRDSTLEWLIQYQKLDERIVIIRHELHSGLPALRINEGIFIARGRYIAYQSADQEWFPNCLEDLYREIEKAPEPSLVYGSFLSLQSVLHHKSVFDKCGLFDPHVILKGDSARDFLYRAASAVPVIRIDKRVAGFHRDTEEREEYPGQGAHIKRFMGIPRSDLLSYKNIESYPVDEMAGYQGYFDEEEIDEINRFVLIPYKNKKTYFYTAEQLCLENISRPRTKTLMIVKWSFSTSIDVHIRNFTNRIAKFPYRFFFIDERTLIKMRKSGSLKPEDYDICILYKTVEHISALLMTENRNRRKPTLYVMDDNMLLFYTLGKEVGLPPGSEKYGYLEEQVRGSHAILTYNALISKYCRRYNPHIIQNSINIPSKYLDTGKTSRGHRIRFAVFTGSIRRREFSWLWPVLREISEKYKDRIEFHFWGLDPSEFGRLHCPVHYRPFTHSYEQYLNALRRSFFHYHICLLDGKLEVSRSKTAIKFLEGTVAGAVGIFSDVEPYHSLPGSQCIKAKNDRDHWKAALEKAIETEEATRWSIYERARKAILKEFTTEHQAHHLIAALEAVELHAKLGTGKIAYFFHNTYLGGSVLHLFKHALMAREMGFEVILCAPKSFSGTQDLGRLAQKLGLSVTYLKDYRGAPDVVLPTGRDLQDARPLKEWMLENKVGLVHSESFIPSVGLACKKAGIPHLMTLHQFYGSNIGDETAKILEVADFIHSSSNRYAAMWSEKLGIPAGKIACPVDTIYFDLFERNLNLAGSSGQEIVVLLSGTVEPRKNQLSAIKAIGLLKEWGYPVKLVLIGYTHRDENYSAACIREIKKAGLKNNVEIHGFKENPVEYYKGYAQFLLCCSVNESMPQTVLQAMAAGVLVVSADVGGVGEILEDRYNGIVMDGTDERSIAEALKRAMDLDGDRRKEMLISAHDTARMVCEPSFVRSELMHLYNETYDRHQNRIAARLRKGPLTGEITVRYQSHIQFIGWQDWVEDGMVSGTEEPFRMEAVRIQLVGAGKGVHVKYRVHVQDKGWMEWKADGEMAGTTGKGLRMEAICIRLEGATDPIHIQYRVLVEGLGWQNWVQDGQMAGTVGESRKILALCIRITP